MRKAGIITVAAAAALLAACNDDITVPQYNNPLGDAVASDPASLQLLANGIGFTLAGLGNIDDLGTLGRESLEYTPTEGRNTTNYLQVQTLDPAGFAAGAANYARAYNNLRNINSLLTAVEGINVPTVTAANKRAANGFAKTMEAYEILFVVSTRDTLGAVVQVLPGLTDVAPFVSRDSAYKFISARLDEAAADLTAAGTAAFPFTIALQFQGQGLTPVNPASFLRFNRALAARVYAYRGSIEPRDARVACGSGALSCYGRALTALDASFLNAAAANRAALDAGVYQLFGTGNGENQNTLSRATNTGRLRVAHPSIVRDTAAGAAARDANGRALYTIENTTRANDLRVRAKIVTLPAPVAAPSAIAASQISTPYGFSIYTTAGSPVPIIKNEELILLRAEANIGLNNLGAALTDINTIRTVSGGLTPLTTLGTRDQAIDALLAERRLSLLYEGHRLIDLRRLNRLNLIPLDKIPTAASPVANFINSVLPIPQGECLSRASRPDLRPASCT